MRWSLSVAILLAACSRDTTPGQPAPQPPAQVTDAANRPTPPADSRAGAARARPSLVAFADLRGWRMFGWGASLSNAKKALDRAGLAYKETGGRGSYLDRKPRRANPASPGAKPSAPRIHHRYTNTLALADGITRLRFVNFRLVSAIGRGHNLPEHRAARKALAQFTTRYGPPHRAEKRGTFDAQIWENADTRLIAYIVTDTSRKNLVTHWLIERWEPVKK